MSNTIYILWVMVQQDISDPPVPVIQGFIWDSEEVVKEWSAKHPDRGYWVVEEMTDFKLNAT